MSSKPTITQTKVALGALLKKLSISKVVCVDDEHAPALTLEDILGWLDGASPEEVANLFPEFEGRIQSDLDIRKKLFETWWEGLEQTARDSSSESARSTIQEEDLANSPDTSNMSILSGVFEEISEVEFLPIRPRDWEARSEELLSSPSINSTLFLFDQDMSKDGGQTNEGSKIVGNLLNRQISERPLCGILTHTVTLDSQKQRWEELAAEAGVARDDFMVIPKSLLTDDLQGFTIHIKSAILSPAFRELKSASEEILKSSLAKATEELSSIDVLDFNHMVMRVAHGEGMWEGQLLFRLYSHFHQAEAAKQARVDTKLTGLIQRVRQVSGLPEFSESRASESIRTICHTELYEDGEVINSAHLDIAVGDVFVCQNDNAIEKAAKATWITATQACDLMLRPNGERNVKYITLLKVVEFTKSKWNSEAKKNARYHKLEHFDTNSDGPVRAIDFLTATLIPSWVLDACVLNKNGASKIQYESSPVNNLLPSWSVHFGEVLTEAKQFCDRYNLARIDDKEMREQLLRQISPSVSSCGTIVASISEDDVSIPLRRVKRLRIDAATEVIRKYASYMARTPTDVDLSRNVKSA